MLKKLKKPNSEGFTIIEIMIVLAIAGLILLIVFLAVPALQRNARNTAIKNDDSTLAGGITTYQSDNNGTIPTSVAGTGSVVIKSASGNSETSKVQGSTAVTTIAAVPATVPTGTVQVLIGQTCPTALGGTGTTSTRAFSIFYSVETSGGNTLTCLDS